MNVYHKIFDGLLKKGMGISNITDEFFALAVNELFKKEKEGILIVTPTLYEANKMYEIIKNYVDETYLFPMDDFLASQAVAISPEYLLKRLEVLNELKKNDKKIVITHLEGYLAHLENISDYDNSYIKIKVNDKLSIDQLVEKLIDNGYKREILVQKTGDIGVRGFVLDIYGALDDYPVRLEFFDDEVESIRYFDPDTQRSIKKCDSVTIKPFIDSKIATNGNNFSSICHYFKKKITIYKDFNQIRNNYEKLVNDIFEIKGKDTKIDDYIFELDDLYDSKAIHYLDFDSTLIDKDVEIKRYGVKNIDSFNENIDKLLNFLKDNYGKKTIILSMQKSFQNKLLNYLDIDYILTDKDNIFENRINIITERMNKGFIYDKYVFLTEREIYNYKIVPKRVKSSFKCANKITNINKLEIGDYVVHNLYGIGIYNGVKTLTKNGLKKDYLEVLYAKSDKLYIPVEKIDLIGKYSGRDGTTPKINSLGGQDWEKTKNRIRENLENVSREIILVQAKRKLQKGYKFSKDTSMQLMFENEFPYEVTPDQEKAINDVKKDMESIIPMDRMICGDVGYGKTEVAFRAAFKAVADSKQVLYLCPTTLLSNQIYTNAKERFKNYPVRIALLNRFVSQKETTKILKELESGEIDFLIGTHRILSDDIKPKDLGLLIIDEEQRFGVLHKEKIKEYKNNVDILTLTATPIPRTLQMALLGLKDLSTINTPPANRLPVQTYVIEENDYLIRNVIYKELSRNGQVFVLDNRINDLDRRLNQLKRLVPDAKIAYAHGKMTSTELEDCTIKFIDGEYDVLLCTTIIENGIDIPNVNSLIVLDSDRLGLSQLYQIRGRVGRSNRLAYAYLMYDKSKVLNETAVKRLNVIKEYSDLGSGFGIANKDLAIRGAGDILGSEQAGFIESVGIDMYFKLLNRQVAILKGEVIEEEVKESTKPLLNVETHIDDNYVSDVDLKIEIHKKINEVDSYEKMEEIKQELEDRFGKLDDILINYMYEEWFEKLADKNGVINVDEKPNYIEIVFSKEKSNSINYEDLFVKSLKISREFQFKYKNNLFYIKLLTNNLDKSPIYYLNELLKEM